MRGKVHKHNNMCTREQCQSPDYTQVTLVVVDVVHRPTPETCDDSVFEKVDSEDIKDGQRAHTIYGTLPPPKKKNIKPDLGFPRE